VILVRIRRGRVGDICGPDRARRRCHLRLRVRAWCRCRGGTRFRL
jgi:hypothetical protein